MIDDERATIFNRVQSATASLHGKTPLPDFDDMLVVRRGFDASLEDLWAAFAARLQTAHGHVFGAPGDLVQWLRAQGCTRGYCDPSLWATMRSHFDNGFSVETTFERSQVDDYQFGLTLAQGAIAETGTIILRDASGTPRLAALAPWVHIAAIRRAEILPTLPAAVSALGDDPNIVWVSGPSKTGDIESVLVEGVHGPGVQAALLID